MTDSRAILPDAVTTLGSGVDGSVRRHTYSFTDAGLPYQQTSYNAASGGSVVNQDQDAYNGLWQLVAEYQAVNGSVNTSTTPAVQYSYNLMAGGANNSNLRAMTLPDGQILDYQYGAGQEPVTGIAVSGSTATVTTAVADGLSTGATVVIEGSTQAALNGTFTITAVTSTTFTYTFTGSASSDSSAYITETPFSLDTAIGRVDGLQDQATIGAGTAGTVESAYLYLGLSTLVQQNDGNGTELSYIQQSPAPTPTPTTLDSAGDQYTGLDRFGRVVYQNWFNTSTGAQTQGDQYGYDNAGDVLFDNVVGQGATAASYSQLYHASSTTLSDNSNAYDPLGRETTFIRGTLSASGNNTSSDAPLDTVANASINTAAGSKQAFSLDAVGNRPTLGSGAGTGTSTAPTLASTTNTFNSQNEFSTSGDSYNNNGDETANGALTSLAYDAWDELTSASTDIGPYEADTFAYDANGRQISDDGYYCTYSYGSSTYSDGCCCWSTQDIRTNDPAEYYDDIGQVVQDDGAYSDTLSSYCDVTSTYSCGCCCCSYTTCYFSFCCTCGCSTDTYTWGTDYVNDLVLRDTTGTVQTWDDVNGSITSTSSTPLTPQRIYPEHDANFNIRTLTSNSGTVLEHIDYDAFGNATVLTSAYATTTTAFGNDSYNWIYGFQGGRYAVNSGLYHFGARNYNPVTGTWMQQDPDGYGDGSDLYQAFRGNPRTMTDPGGTTAAEQELWQNMIDYYGKNEPAGEARDTKIGYLKELIKYNQWEEWDWVTVGQTKQQMYNWCQEQKYRQKLVRLNVNVNIARGFFVGRRRIIETTPTDKALNASNIAHVDVFYNGNMIRLGFGGSVIGAASVLRNPAYWDSSVYEFSKLVRFTSSSFTLEAGSAAGTPAKNATDSQIEDSIRHYPTPSGKDVGVADNCQTDVRNAIYGSGLHGFDSIDPSEGSNVSKNWQRWQQNLRDPSTGYNGDR